MMRHWLVAVAVAIALAPALAAATGCKAASGRHARARGQRSAAHAAFAGRTATPAPWRRWENGPAWNPAHIRWRSYAQGLARAKTEHRPVCLVFFATWCPHCRHYSHVFDDPRVVAEAKKFVMIRLDADRNRDLSSRYKLDGEYVPRTYFLTPKGEVLPAVHARRARYQYFYNERNPASLLGGMKRAEKLLD